MARVVFLGPGPYQELDLRSLICLTFRFSSPWTLGLGVVDSHRYRSRPEVFDLLDISLFEPLDTRVRFSA